MQFLKSHICIILFGLFLAYLPLSFYLNDGIGAMLAGGGAGSLPDPMLIILALIVGIWTKADWRGLIGAMGVAGGLGAMVALQNQEYYGEKEPMYLFSISTKFVACLLIVCVSGYLARLKSKS